MPQKVFLELNEEKQDRITEAAIREFAEFGYENSSTNRIVKNSGISKGSLFKYFESKEEMYFYLIDLVSAQMAEEMKVDVEALPKDLYERVIAYSTAEISWYTKNPEKGKFIIGVAAEKDSEIARKINERYGGKSIDIYEGLLQGVDTSNLKHKDMKEVSEVLKWVLQGVNREYRDKDSYMEKLKVYLDILKTGL